MSRYFILLLFCINPIISWAQSQKISPDLRKFKADDKEVEFFLIFDQHDLSHIHPEASKKEKGRLVHQSLVQQAEITQEEVRIFLQQKQIPFHSFYLVNTIFIKSNLEIVEALSKFDQVKKVIPHSKNIMKQFPVESYEHKGRSVPFVTWGLELIRADEVWKLGIKGQGVVVGGQDTGYDWSHPALKNGYRGWLEDFVDHRYNWFDAINEINQLHQDSIIMESNNPCGLQIRFPCDDDQIHSHGTHTMGTMVGYDPILDLHIGVAPEAKWIGVRNMERGYGTPYTYLAGFEWFLAPTDLDGNDPDPDLAPDVINNSWACPPMEGCYKENFYIIETAIENLRRAGIVVVVSAGNEGRAGCETIQNPPAIFESSFTVGSVDANDSLSDFSSRGPVVIDSSFRIKPNVTAPGRGVLSSQQNGKYGFLSGTSMAGPHVAGVVALIISANPDLKGRVELIESIIEKSAVTKTDANLCIPSSRGVSQNALYGFGRIDAYEAVMLALSSTTFSEQKVTISGIICSPNPVRERLFISWPAKARLNDLYILDITGKNIMHRSIANELSLDLDVKEIPGGLYIIVAHGDSHYFSEKFIVQH